MKNIAYFLLGILIFMYIQISTSSNNPCSQFSSHPSLCSSDMQENIK
jgi:hypothetical protein